MTDHRSPITKGNAMKRLTPCLVITLALIAPVALAQRIKIEVPESVVARAAETVDVTLDASMLRLAGKFLSNTDADERAVKDMVGKLEGIYVKSYEFDEDGAYDRGIVDKVRGQLGPNWKRIVTVQSRKKANVEVYTDMRGEQIAGLLIISDEPRELTLVNIVGPVDLDKLASLEGQFGIPRMSKDKDKGKDKDKDKNKEKEQGHDE
jgi:hypothetical protein